ncbi:MAG: acetyl-CoA decarbonylase/synthase complex subunit gamma [Candidatus Omnitrophica bacterium]|nr:acetyl-CoA decarbonylase/synthase complex subunit gamma [Candidatus Omnitrophota bacterium]MDD5592587.1 acetyl-CoA decarbonylase/synthase complex subunit gamma [Candidatus Omnitrophota bacterium]
MALSGLDIYKLLPKTNCRECGFVTCLAFAMQLAKKAVSIDKCPYLSDESKRALEASSQPPIKLVSIGEGENKLETGNETVLFRHEEKFHRPTGIGFIIEDNLSEKEIKEKLHRINQLKFERIGQELNVNLIAVKQAGDKNKFAAAIQIVLNNTPLALTLMSNDAEALKEALEISKQRRPLICSATKDNLTEFSKLAKEYQAALVVSDGDLETLSNLTKELSSQGVSGLILDVGAKPAKDKIWDFTQIRRQALKKSNRSLGYPVLAIIDSKDPYEEAIEAATYISKYAGIVLMRGIEAWQILSLLTLRQNIYTDPQKPLQIEPKLYPVGAADKKSPVLVTTNFSLTYYTVLGEVEASKVPSYILSVDTEGMSVLTAWAAEKFTPEKVADTLNKFSVKDAVAHNRLVIPGYVAVMSGDLEEKSGWQVVVGPKEAAGIPSFLKNL